jgi:hypothetical protein
MIIIPGQMKEKLENPQTLETLNPRLGNTNLKPYYKP